MIPLITITNVSREIVFFFFFFFYSIEEMDAMNSTKFHCHLSSSDEQIIFFFLPSRMEEQCKRYAMNNYAQFLTASSWWLALILE